MAKSYLFLGMFQAHKKCFWPFLSPQSKVWPPPMDLIPWQPAFLLRHCTSHSPWTQTCDHVCPPMGHCWSLERISAFIWGEWIQSGADFHLWTGSTAGTLFLQAKSKLCIWLPTLLLACHHELFTQRSAFALWFHELMRGLWIFFMGMNHKQFLQLWMFLIISFFCGESSHRPRKQSFMTQKRWKSGLEWWRVG